MDERLEAFRTRLRGSTKPQKKERKAREWFAILVSISALAVSITTAYFGTIRQVEELHIFVGNSIPTASWTDDGRLQIEGALDLAFLNTGTRPILILSADLLINQDEEIRSDDQCNFHWAGVPLDLNSFVVKEKESVAKLINLKLDPHLLAIGEVTKDGRIILRPSKTVPPKAVEICVRIAGATPSRPLLSAEIKLSGLKRTPKGIQSSYFLPTSTTFWTRQGTIFDLD